MTGRKRIMVYATERDYEMISKLAKDFGSSMSWVMCHLARRYAKGDFVEKKKERDERHGIRRD